MKPSIDQSMKNRIIITIGNVEVDIRHDETGVIVDVQNGDQCSTASMEFNNNGGE